jgi:hypothetical protein
MKALLLYEGIAFPGVDGTETWTRAVFNELATLECKESVRFKLDSLLATLAFHKKEAVAALKQIRILCEKEPELRGSIKYLCTVPGIGWITASHVVSRIGDWRLLHSPNQIAGFLIVEAADIAAAAGLFHDHPHITVFPGDGIDVMPVVTGPPED